MLISGVKNSLSPFTGAGKFDAFFADLAHLAQAPDLKTSRVGEDGLVPLLKRVQTAKAGHHVQAGAHPQMKRVAQNDLRAHVLQAARHHAFDRAVGAHRHEDGGLHHAVVEGKGATAGVAALVGAGSGVGGEEVELQHAGIVWQSPCDPAHEKWSGKFRCFTIDFALLFAV